MKASDYKMLKIRSSSNRRRFAALDKSWLDQPSRSFKKVRWNSLWKITLTQSHTPWNQENVSPVNIKCPWICVPHRRESEVLESTQQVLAALWKQSFCACLLKGLLKIPFPLQPLNDLIVCKGLRVFQCIFTKPGVFYTSTLFRPWEYKLI